MQDELEKLRRRVAELEKLTGGASASDAAQSAPDHLKLLNAVPDIVYSLDRDGYFTFVNEAVRMIDYEPSELIGRHFTEIIHPDEAACVARRYILPGYNGTNAGGENAPRLFDERRAADRKTKDLVVQLVSKGHAEVSPDAAAGLGPSQERPSQERQSQERSSQERQGRTRQLQNPEAMVFTGDVCAAGLYDDNEGFIGTIGVIRDITERSRRDLEIKSQLERIESVIYGPHGESSPRPGGPDHGQNDVPGVGSNADISHGHRLADANEFLRKVMDSAANAIFAADLTGRMMLVNTGLTAISGYSVEELIDRNFLTLFDADGQSGLADKFKKTASCGLPIYGLETVIVRGGGARRVISFGMSPLVRGDDIACIVCTAEDITERKLFEEQLRENARQLEQLNLHLLDRVEEETQKRLYHEHILIQQSKMAAMGEMIAAIAHQWRQPINAIGLIVQDMDDAYDFGEVDKPYLTTVISGVMEQILFMSNTIDDFRNFFAADKDRTIFDAKKAVESVLSILAEQFRNKSIRVLHDCSCQQHSMKLCDNLSIGICSNGYMNISGYRNEFKQVVLNILNNAREAIEDAKERREAADRRSAGTRDSSHGASSHALSSGGEISVAMSFHPQDSIVEIRISDTGGGIPDDVMPNIFKPYYTTKGDLKGTGIGLYLAKTIVENNMGGTIDAANSEKGAVFTIRLKHAP